MEVSDAKKLRARRRESAPEADGWEQALLLFPLHTGLGSASSGRFGGQTSTSSWRICIRRSAASGFTTIKAPKSNRQRWVDLTLELAAALRSIRHRAELIFCPDDRSMLRPGQFQEVLWAAQRRAGLRRIKWHDLRHSVALILASLRASRGVHAPALRDSSPPRQSAHRARVQRRERWLRRRGPLTPLRPGELAGGPQAPFALCVTPSGLEPRHRQIRKPKHCAAFHDFSPVLREVGWHQVGTLGGPSIRPKSFGTGWSCQPGANQLLPAASAWATVDDRWGAASWVIFAVGSKFA